jgi:hypothetical protein
MATGGDDEVFGEYDDGEARARRREAVAAARGRFPSVRAKFAEAYDLRLPEHLAWGVAFFLGLSNAERRLCPAGLWGFTEHFAWLAPGEPERVASPDARLHGRYRRDPPEFVTIAHGDGDGSHWGLFYDLPTELPRLVAHGRAHDDGAVWHAGTTLLGAIRGELGGGRLDPDDERRRRAMIAWLDALHRRELEAHRREGVGPPPAARLDGGGAGLGPYLPGFEPPDELRSYLARFAAYRARDENFERWVARARGDANLAVLLGRELHYLDYDDATRELGIELLRFGYRALGRDALAAVAEVHHAHRDAPGVYAYATREQLAELAKPAPAYVTPPLVLAARALRPVRARALLALGPPPEDVGEALEGLSDVVSRLEGDDAKRADEMFGLLLHAGGARAASHALFYYLIRLRAHVAPDLMAKASRPRATASQESAECQWRRPDRRFVDRLLAAGARATRDVEVESAVATGLPDLVEHVLRAAPAGFDPKAYRTHYTLLEGTDRPNGGATLLHLAVGTASVDAVRHLVALGLDPDAKDDAGETPRDLARLLWTLRPRESHAMLDLFGRPEAPAPAAPPRPLWEPGALARHAKFGEGKVTAVSGDGPEAKVTVEFAAGGARTLLAKFLARPDD